VKSSRYSEVESLVQIVTKHIYNSGAANFDFDILPAELRDRVLTSINTGNSLALYLKKFTFP